MSHEFILSARDNLYGTFASSEYTAKKIPGAKFIGYETGGHMLIGHDDQANSSSSNFSSQIFGELDKLIRILKVRTFTNKQLSFFQATRRIIA